MASIQKPKRRRKGFMEGPDQVLRLNHLYRFELFGGRQPRDLMKSSHAAFDDVASPEPFEDLDESDISDNERRAAIARERWRRQGRG